MSQSWKTLANEIISYLSGSSTSANQATQITAEQAILAKLPDQVGGKIPVDASVSITGLPSLEGTDKAKVSLWVRKTANGDTVLTLGKAEDADSIPVALSTEALAALATSQLQSYGYKAIGVKTLIGVAQAITLPAGSRVAFITARGGDINMNINADATASTNLIPEGTTRPVYVASGVTSLSVYGVTGTYADYEVYG